MLKVRSAFATAPLTGTEWATAADKALYLEKLARFVEAGFPEKRFTGPIYSGLNLHLFGHIAHFDKDGFYHTWFSTEERRREWVRNALRSTSEGDPAYTWSDAEAIFQEWLATEYH